MTAQGCEGQGSPRCSSLAELRAARQESIGEMGGPARVPHCQGSVRPWTSCGVRSASVSPLQVAARTRRAQRQSRGVNEMLPREQFHSACMTVSVSWGGRSKWHRPGGGCRLTQQTPTLSVWRPACALQASGPHSLGSQGVLPASCSFCGSRVLSMWPRPLALASVATWPLPVCLPSPFSYRDTCHWT